MKPIKAKPHFYAVCLQPMQEIAREMGYVLMVHGSMDRDMDLIAVPWVDDPRPELELIQAIDQYLKGTNYTGESAYFCSTLSGGRHCYIINIDRGGPFNGYIDNNFYLDISITPLVVSPNQSMKRK